MFRMALLAVLLITACSGAAETPGAEPTDAVAEATTAEAEPPTETPSTTASPDAGGSPATMVDTAAFCDALVQAEMTLNVGPDVDFESAGPDEIEAAMSEFAALVEPALETVEAEVPEELSDEIGTVTDLVRQGLETGEDPFGSPEFQQADQAIDEWMGGNCDIEVTDVTAVDYAYEGVPSTMTAGQVGFRLDNQGDEVHEFALMRKRDDVAESFQEILEADDQSKVEFTGAAFAEPGDADTFYADLQAGEYLAVCFIPIGATSMEDLEAADTTEPAPGSPELGAPHFTQGMTAEFTVE